MPLVELWGTRVPGIIICFPTGITFTNQTGGTACRHPKEEGCFVPIRGDYEVGANDFLPEKALTDYFVGSKWRGSGATCGIDQEDADFIDDVLVQNKITHSVRVDRDRLRESHEAWIYVTILADEEDLFSGFGPYPRSGILTWPNSD